MLLLLSWWALTCFLICSLDIPFPIWALSVLFKLQLRPLDSLWWSMFSVDWGLKFFSSIVIKVLTGCKRNIDKLCLIFSLLPKHCQDNEESFSPLFAPFLFAEAPTKLLCHNSPRDKWNCDSGDAENKQPRCVLLRCKICLSPFLPFFPLFPHFTFCISLQYEFFQIFYEYNFSSERVSQSLDWSIVDKIFYQSVGRKDKCGILVRA